MDHMLFDSLYVYLVYDIIKLFESGDNVLVLFAIVLLIVVIVEMINEKTFKISNDIALVIFSLIIAACLKILAVTNVIDLSQGLIGKFMDFDFASFLMEGVLCFMLFAGASKVCFKRLIKNIKTISLLAFFTTFITSLVFGLLFYGIALIVNIEINFLTCLLLGCIVSPTDPIAATSILNKAGLSKNVTTTIEGESLFNDGMGVVLFIFIKALVIGDKSINFPLLMVKEILGAVAVSLIISAILIFAMKKTNKAMTRVFISLLAVSSIYVVCEYFGFSGVLASVICGIVFSLFMAKNERNQEVVDQRQIYNDFWNTVDLLMNSILFVYLGVSILFIDSMPHISLLIISAIVLNIIARFAGVFISSIIANRKHIPNRYSIFEFTSLMTWSALKGGLSLALVLSTKSFLSEEVYNILLVVTCTMIFFTIIFQGLTTSNIYRKIEKLKKKRLANMLPLEKEND